MKKIFIMMFGLFMFSTSSQAAFYDFTAQGNHIERGYDAFDTDTNPDNIMDGGLLVVSAAGPNVPDGPLSEAFVYMDSSSGGPGGLGVCKELRANLTCNPNSDDNMLSTEIVGMLFDDATDYLGLTIIGDHKPVVAGTTFNWATAYSGHTWARRGDGVFRYLGRQYDAFRDHSE